ncbi:MAG: hypothetical protein ACOC56_02560 [Atribacterota bacterium]
MIKLAYKAQNKIIKFEINKKQVIYFDDIWKNGIQIMPKNQNMIEKMRRGNKNLRMMAELIIDTNKGKNFEEYLKCRTDEDVARIIRKDCKSKGLVEV